MVASQILQFFQALIFKFSIRNGITLRTVFLNKNIYANIKTTDKKTKTKQNKIHDALS